MRFCSVKAGLDHPCLEDAHDPHLARKAIV